MYSRFCEKISKNVHIAHFSFFVISWFFQLRFQRKNDEKWKKWDFFKYSGESFLEQTKGQDLIKFIFFVYIDVNDTIDKYKRYHGCVFMQKVLLNVTLLIFHFLSLPVFFSCVFNAKIIKSEKNEFFISDQREIFLEQTKEENFIKLIFFYNVHEHWTGNSRRDPLARFKTRTEPVLPLLF